jgi:hypothetical protein
MRLAVWLWPVGSVLTFPGGVQILQRFILAHVRAHLLERSLISNRGQSAEKKIPRFAEIRLPSYQLAYETDHCRARRRPGVRRMGRPSVWE